MNLASPLATTLPTTLDTPLADPLTWPRRAGGALRRVVSAPLSAAMSALMSALARWPFPPQPGAALPMPVGQRQAGSMPVAPAAPPVPAAPAAAAASVRDASIGDARRMAVPAGRVGVRRMVIDILLVGIWGAMIPALMWLGAAAGF
ncbi:hypothetical protein [Bordetella sp. 2513F-2]